MRVAVIGGGPAGSMAAIKASEKHEVVLFERNEKLGKKLYLTGKGRCNVTNDKDISEFFDEILRNPHFLYSSLYTFTNEDLKNFFEPSVPLKTERGDRVFPCSDKSSDIIRHLERELANVDIRKNTFVKTIRKTGDFRLETSHGSEDFQKVVLATGGVTYPGTGSDGYGLSLAKKLGHSIVVPVGALLPYDLKEPMPELAGLTLKNVEITGKGGGKSFTERGEVLITHRGISGPLILTLSSYFAGIEKVSFLLDLKPALSQEELDRSLLRMIEKNPRQELKTLLKERLPQNFIGSFLEKAKVDPRIKGHDLTREMRRHLGEMMKAFPLGEGYPIPKEGGIITAGGVDVKEVDPSTMESKLVEGLYFAGEILDVDALTGGYNLQIAFSTGYLAGTALALLS